ncbi:uncharacterized protein TNCV_283311 [Trichonephila clavipes]|nr:uncharacterized protein TNCV_283311 [Trichonephila clavipes]
MIPSPPLLTDESRCLNIHAIEKEIRIFTARKSYVTTMLEIERSSPSPMEETTKKLEEELLNLETKVQTLEVKNVAQEKNEQLKTNSFAALNAANKDAEDVTQPPLKIKPIFMKITPNYNLLLQEIHRTHPSAKNTHMKGYFKIEAETEDHHREITEYLTKNVGYYVISPPDSRPLKLVIKGLPDDVEPEDIKQDLISKGIKIEKVAQLKKFATKAKLPLFLIEITRDDNINDIYQIRSCLYMQIKYDPFRKSNRVTQCYNCNNFHHASQNCFMKTHCLKCGENHRTGQCPIKEKIDNPLCINCNTKGHMASSTECPPLPETQKGYREICNRKQKKKRKQPKFLYHSRLKLCASFKPQQKPTDGDTRECLLGV